MCVNNTWIILYLTEVRFQVCYSQVLDWVLLEKNLFFSAAYVIVYPPLSIISANAYSDTEQIFQRKGSYSSPFSVPHPHYVLARQRDCQREEEVEERGTEKG